MTSQTSIAAKQVRLMEWAEQIRDCQTVQGKWTWRPGAPSMVLQKQTITTVSNVSGKHAWTCFQIPEPLLLSNSLSHAGRVLKL